MKNFIITIAIILASSLCAWADRDISAQSVDLTSKSTGSELVSRQLDVEVQTGVGHIVVYTNSSSHLDLQVYSITGQLVSTIKVAADPVTVDLPQGCYILRIDRWSKKVVVR